MSQRGLTGSSVLGSHLGFAVPIVVRRGPEQSPEPASPVTEPPRVEAPPTAAIPATETASVVEAIVEEVELQEAIAPKPEDHVLRIKKHGRATVAARSTYRVGTQKNPYERSDGTQTQKITFTGPWGLKRELERFCLDHELSRSEWIVAALRKAMEREQRAADRQTHSG